MGTGDDFYHPPGQTVGFRSCVWTDRQTDRPTERPTDRPTNRPTDRPTNRPTDQPTDRPTDRHYGNWRPSSPSWANCGGPRRPNGLFCEALILWHLRPIAMLTSSKSLMGATSYPTASIQVRLWSDFVFSEQRWGPRSREPTLDEKSADTSIQHWRWRATTQRWCCCCWRWWW